MLKLTVAEYAKTRNCSFVYIYRLIKQGTIPPAALSKKGRQTFIDRQKADAALLRNTVKATPEDKKKQTTETAGTAGLTYQEAKTLSERYKAALLKIDLDQATGKLIDAETVKLAAFNKARAVRDSLLNIGDRCAAILAAETDEMKVNSILTAELRNALEELSR